MMLWHGGYDASGNFGDSAAFVCMYTYVGSSASFLPNDCQDVILCELSKFEIMLSRSEFIYFT